MEYAAASLGIPPDGMIGAGPAGLAAAAHLVARGIPLPSSDFVDTGSSGLAFCMSGGDIAEGGMKPLTIVISFDAGEQVTPGSLPSWIATLMHGFGFYRAGPASIGALPKQLPFRLIDWIIPAASRTLW